MPAAALALLAALSAAAPPGARAQAVEDGSDAAIGPARTRAVLELVGRHLDSPDARVTALRASGPVICGSVDVKNRQGLYTGPRGFVADPARGFFGRVPDGPELISPSRAEAYQAMESVRQLYFAHCLD